MDLRLIAAILAGKLISVLLKLTGSGATAAPGLYALKIDANLVKKITRCLPKGSIIISGTNGKTTTSRLAYEMLSSKHKVIHNRQGSNLLRGIASTLIKKSSLTGKVNAELGLWEIDEATLPEAIDNLLPKTIVLLNLFRDQLDRYGEVDTTRQKMQKSLTKLPKTSLILNADDPGISFLSKFTKARIFYFGVNDTKINLPTIDHVADIKYCLNCSTKLIYKSLFSAHLGHYYCPNCNLKRPSPKVYANNLLFRKDFSTSIKLNVNCQLSIVNCHLPGLYNVYNILAAVALCSFYKIDLAEMKIQIQKFSTAFGRFQQISIGSKSVTIFLIKNPTGANEVLRVLATQNNLNLLIILNDKIADGRDVSWIWDTQWEAIIGKVKNISVAGIRGWDMATRLKYAGLTLSKKYVYEEISYSIANSLSKLDNNDTLIILPTYTALLDVQRSLSKLAGGKKWHEQ